MYLQKAAWREQSAVSRQHDVRSADQLDKRFLLRRVEHRCLLLDPRGEGGEQIVKVIEMRGGQGHREDQRAGHIEGAEMARELDRVGRAALLLLNAADPMVTSVENSCHTFHLDHQAPGLGNIA